MENQRNSNDPVSLVPCTTSGGKSQQSAEQSQQSAGQLQQSAGQSQQSAIPQSVGLQDTRSYGSKEARINQALRKKLRKLQRKVVWQQKAKNMPRGYMYPSTQPMATYIAVPSYTPMPMPSNTPMSMPSYTPTPMPSYTPTSMPSYTPHYFMQYR